MSQPAPPAAVVSETVGGVQLAEFNRKGKRIVTGAAPLYSRIGHFDLFHGDRVNHRFRGTREGVVTMAIQPAAKPIFRFADKDEINRLMDELEEQLGFTPDPDATPEKVQQLMLADGIRPEENAFSREIIRMRYGDQE